jgi:antibiotic biosynthesis monooxygenase (ABM) superfamily enzyme
MSDSDCFNTATAKSDSNEIVTLVVKHRVKARFEAPYEAWLRRIVGIAAQSEGHLGVDMIRGKNADVDVFTCVLRFCSAEALQRWLDSPQRQALINQVAPMLATEIRPRSIRPTSTGLLRWPIPPHPHRVGNRRCCPCW